MTLLDTVGKREPHPFTDAPHLPVAWPNYSPPASRVSALAQRPLSQIDGDRLANAVMGDWRDARRSLPSDQDTKRAG